MQSVAMSETMSCIVSNDRYPTILKNTFQLNDKLNHLPRFQTKAHAKGILIIQ